MSRGSHALDGDLMAISPPFSLSVPTSDISLNSSHVFMAQGCLSKSSREKRDSRPKGGGTARRRMLLHFGYKVIAAPRMMER